MNEKKFKKYYNCLILIFSILSVIIALLDMTTGLEGILVYIYEILLIFFIIDYFTRLIISKNKLTFFKKNIFDLIAIIPFNIIFKVNKMGKVAKMAKLVKISKLAKLSTFIAYIMRFSTKITRFLHTNEFRYTIFVSTIIIIMGATILHSYENMPFLDSFWHCVITVSTLGYGDFIIVKTTIGKIINNMLIFTGVGVLGALSSTVTVFIVREEMKHKEKIKHKNEQKQEGTVTLSKKYDMLDEEIKENINDIINREYEKKVSKDERIL